jgi:hypothetical protein
MNQFTFSRGIGLCIGTATLFGAFLTGGCGSSDDAASQSPIAESEEALRRPLCDGPLHLSCAAGQYCNAIAAGRCPGPRQFGMCAAQPQLCTELFDPVCGCDGKTYPNACHAGAAGVAVAHDGACAAQVACGGIAARPCPGAGRCVDDPSDDCDPANGGADCGGICSCIQTQLCIRGSHFDNDPAVCACVPDAAPDKCAAVTCPTGQVCCPNCGVCQPQGLACSKNGCTN